MVGPKNIFLWTNMYKFANVNISCCTKYLEDICW